MVALARVTASCYGYNHEDEAGYRAPSCEEACRLLQVDGQNIEGRLRTPSRATP